MLQINDRLTCKIEDIAFGGQGVAKSDGMVIFVPFTIPGETVEIQITDIKKDFAIGKAIQVCTPSEQRIEPRCPYFTVCQGCAYQHMQYTEECKWKTKQVKDIFERIGGFPDPPIEKACPSPQEFQYRNKVRGLVCSQRISAK